MRWRNGLISLLCGLLLTACGERHPLPFPTPAQSELIVLTQKGPLAYQDDDDQHPTGLEHDLVEAFAQELGVEVRYVVVPPEEIPTRLANHEAHMAAGWLSANKENRLVSSTPFLHSQDVLIQPEASLPIRSVKELDGKTVHVQAGSRQAATLRAIKATGINIDIVEHQERTTYELLELAEAGTITLAAVDSARFEVALQFAPSLVATLPLSEAQPIGWLFPPQPNTELLAQANAFIDRAERDGTLARIEDRYFGHIRRLTQGDILKFMENISTVLPKLRKYFEMAQQASSVDWRLLAALAYQESQWDVDAVSPTGVRGIMMLTEDTADHLGVSNRLDPEESIVAGARYLDQLRDQMPDSVREPDRTWLALAAYNIGPGHFNTARALARQLDADSNTWFDMKRVLPLLAQPRYYRKLKSGPARGGEAVIMTENVRSFYDILRRHEPLHRPLKAETATPAKTKAKANKAKGPVRKKP